MPAIGGWAREAVRTLNPSYFALVMATGIMSVAMQIHHAYPISVTLLWLAGIEYVTLLGVYVWRLARYRSAVAADLSDPARAFGYFTFVAATDVLGTRLALDQHRIAALVLLAAGWPVWLVLGYVIPWTSVLGHAHHPILPNANGTWFIWAVASQSIAVLAATLEPSVGTGRRELALLAVVSWSVGIFLYAAAGILVAARLLLYRVQPDNVTPPYWVSMGATAITVLAGARIVEMADTPMVTATRGLVAGASVVFWAFGTWLIPPLVAAGVWRHVVHRIPLRYEATLWSIVFPIGMYGAGSHYLGQTDHLPAVNAIGANESWVALAVWSLAFVAMLAHLARPPARSASAG
jgi:tellurite resistance protein TehA-like permease